MKREITLLHFIVWLSLGSCILNKKMIQNTYSNNPFLSSNVDVDVVILDTFINDSPKRKIVFLFKNLYKNKLLLFSTPCLQANTHFKLYEEQKEIPINFIIKVEPSCSEKYVSVNTLNIVKVTFQDNLDDLFDIKLNTTYRLEVNYSGIIKSSVKEIIKNSSTTITKSIKIIT